MCQTKYFDPLLQFIEELYTFLFDISSLPYSFKYSSKIRLHTKDLDKIGDLNFPLRIHNWTQWLKKNLPLEEVNKYLNSDNKTTVLKTSRHNCGKIEDCLKELQSELNKKSCVLKVRETELQKYNVHLYFDRLSAFSVVIYQVISKGSQFGYNQVINCTVTLNESLRLKAFDNMNLTELRTLILESFTSKLLDILHDSDMESQVCEWSQNSSLKHGNTLFCGPVLNQDGIKDTETTAKQLLDKRSDVMRSMAEHRYGYRRDCSADWEEYKAYFHKLGKAAVTVEMLEQRPHKGIKIALNECSTMHKGPTFIFYNCARLGVLFEKYDKKVEEGIYPPLPLMEEVNFELLKESEEWELLYVYILQFPSVIRSCIIVDEVSEKLEVLPQNLTMFLSRLSCVFSTYYRRVKILMDPREHLFPILHARLYLLKALQVIFHNALSLLDIEPVRRM